MNRYFLFGSEAYEAAGGFHDFLGSYPSIRDAVEEAEKLCEAPGSRSIDWWHIYDSTDRKMVASGLQDELPKLDGAGGK